MLLPVHNVRQRQQADCLVACAAMVLAFLKFPADYDRLRRILGTTSLGTPFSRLQRLGSRRIGVDVGVGDLRGLWTRLEDGLPVIVDVQTWMLPHWRTRTDLQPIERDTNHAMVVVGLDVSNVYVNDPDFAAAPLAIPHDAFLASWLERDHRFAVIH